jgi:hypothetical protein
MSAIKLHVEQAERDAIERYAETLKVSVEDVAYAALNRLMMRAGDPDIGRDIAETRDWRRHNLPLWSDSACSVHAYEGKGDSEPSPSRLF